MPVTVVTVEKTDTAVYGEYAARVRGFREIEVRARVSGILETRLFMEGQRVEEGTALFQIEPAPYQIALRQAEAERSNAQAAYNQAKREWERIGGLFAQDAVSERDRDSALSNYELAAARMESTEALVANAALQLEYTRVPAPISGFTGMEVLSEGSLVDRGTLLTTIVQHDPVQVRFSIPERDARNRSDPDANEIEVILANGERVPGMVDFADSTIDPRTGSVRLRAVLDNPDGQLVPGQFVRVRILLARHQDVFAIEPAAVGEGTDGRQVFVLEPDNTVAIRPVRIGPMVDGKQVILAGLESGDQLVVNGHVALRPGMPVVPRNQDGEGR